MPGPQYPTRKINNSKQYLIQISKLNWSETPSLFRTAPSEAFRHTTCILPWHWRAQAQQNTQLRCSASPGFAPAYYLPAGARKSIGSRADIKTQLEQHTRSGRSNGLGQANQQQKGGSWPNRNPKSIAWSSQSFEIAGFIHLRFCIGSG